MKVDTDFPTQVFLFTMFVVQMGQIYIPCYYGNEIMLQSNALINHIYFSNWTEMTQRSKRSIIIFMERLKRETQIIVGKLFPLNLETFTTVRLSFYEDLVKYICFCSPNFCRSAYNLTDFLPFCRVLKIKKFRFEYCNRFLDVVSHFQQRMLLHYFTDCHVYIIVYCKNKLYKD